MLSVRGTYDGVNLKLSENVAVTQPIEVIVTFLKSDEDELQADINKLLGKTRSLEFLTNEEEDIYTDADLKVKY